MEQRGIVTVPGLPEAEETDEDRYLAALARLDA
jgi:hypothetical protein